MLRICFTHLLVAETFDVLQNKEEKEFFLDNHIKHAFEDENLEMSSIMLKCMWCPNMYYLTEVFLSILLYT